MAKGFNPCEYSCACHGNPRSGLLPESYNRGTQQQQSGFLFLGRVKSYVKSSTQYTVEHFPASLIAGSDAAKANVWWRSEQEQTGCVSQGCSRLPLASVRPCYVRGLLLCSCSQEKPVVASGTFARGEWETVTGREKIQSVRIELDERAVRGSLANVDLNLAEPWVSA